MNVLWNNKSLKKLTKGDYNKSWEATGVSIDSRNIKKGDLFCAIKGKNFDGHDFLEEALSKGASAGLISEHKPKFKNIPYFKVNNVLKTIEKMAKKSRQSSNARFVSITGSVGKTGTKDMMEKCFAKFGKVFANKGSMNNHIGVPLNLCQIPHGTDFCISELGMNRLGEIKKLSRIANPEIAIITAIEPSHLKGLKNLKNIALAKSEIMSGLKKEGCLIINNDANYANLIKGIAKSNKIKNIITYGKNNNSNILLKNIKKEKNNFFINAKLYEKNISWKMPFHSEHWILNSLAILGACEFYSLDINKVFKELQNFSPTEGRGNLINLKYRDKKVLVIDDSYNSSPASMQAALYLIKSKKCLGRKIAILGDMAELGKSSNIYHKKLEKLIVQADINILITLGKFMRVVGENLSHSMKVFNTSNIKELTSIVFKILENNDVLLVKGSNSMGLKKIISFLKDRSANDI